MKTSITGAPTFGEWQARLKIRRSRSIVIDVTESLRRLGITMNEAAEAARKFLTFTPRSQDGE